MADVGDDYRVEHDTMGEVRVPKAARWAAQTQRAVENFPISGRPVNSELIAALGSVKVAAAEANRQLEVVPTEVAEAIKDAASQVAAGRWDDQFPVDVYQTSDHEVVLKTELPDMSREDIDVNIENFVLTIQGEKKASSEVKEEQFHHVERRYGTFSRSFSLPQTVDTSKVGADYKNGVLTVRIPLREDAKPRSIKVDVAA